MRKFRIPHSPLTAALAMCALVGIPTTHHAQQPVSDTLTLERATLQRVLATYLWQHAVSYNTTPACQQPAHVFCVSEHLAKESDRLAAPESFAGLSFGDAVRRLVINNTAGRVDTALSPILALSRGIERLADNGWYAGHLMLLALRVGATDSAFAALNKCRATAGWCTALRGYALHATGQYADAELAFDAALDEMPAAKRCEWNSVEPLLKGEVADRYRESGCAAREEFEQRFWWLSDPLFMMPGNDRRSEHYARRVLDSLLTGGAAPMKRYREPVMWDSGFSDMLMRYGAASHTTAERSTDEAIGAAGMPWLHLHLPSYSFAPRRIPANDAERMSVADWQVDIVLDSTRERYHPAYDYVVEMEQYQHAAFVRDNSIIAVTAVALGEEAIGEAAPFRASVVLSNGPGKEVHARHMPAVAERARFVDTLPRGMYLIGIEAMSESLFVAGRSRFTTGYSNGGTLDQLSDLLLFDATDTLPTELESATARMMYSPRVNRGGAVGIYWEPYGQMDDPRTTYTIVATPVERERPGFFKRLATSVGLVSRPTTLAVGISTLTATDGGVRGRSISVSLAELNDGFYELEVEARSPAGLVAQSRASIEVVRTRSPRARMVDVLTQPVPLTPRVSPPVLRKRVSKSPGAAQIASWAPSNRSDGVISW